MASTTSLNQLRGDEFSFGPVTQSDGIAQFSFQCSRFGSFVEQVDFGTDKIAPDGLLTLLQVALGVSTYKAAAASRVRFPSLTPGGRAMAEALYTEGLAEFFVRSDLPYPPQTVFEGDIIDHQDGDLAFSGNPFVAFGGGKDSYVAGSLLESVTEEPPVFASVVLSPAVEDVLTATARRKPFFIQRRLDPRLRTLEGAFGGHIPITAINMLTMVITSLLHGKGPVIFANERSADEPTMVHNGQSANHQYSKSSAFEELIRVAIAETAPGAPAVYSVLRPYSELWIGQRFARLRHAHPRFTSCNRNFRLAGDAQQRWCGACPKCAFTSLILAPFLSQEAAQVAFGRSMLDLDALQPFYRELCGLTEHKPWECVGTVDECQAALWKIAQSDEWADSKAVRNLYADLLAVAPSETLAAKWQAALIPADRGVVPTAIYDAANQI